MTAWKDYQEEAAAFFRSIGLTAETDKRIGGVRTNHDVDVLVKSHHYGFEITWIVECKQWKSPVSKLHVLGLREIVSDVGADRGILLSEAGFQRGAKEAAGLTNVQVTSLAEMRQTTGPRLAAMRIQDLFDRLENCHDRYWRISKQWRIEDDLRPDVGAFGYSGDVVIGGCRDVISRVIRGNFPFESHHLAAFVLAPLFGSFTSIEDVLARIEPLIEDLEHRLTASEQKRGL
ncbi:restriction endonuclease [Rhizobium binxianense]|uniref:restriction endonuclease n=1 Tax=Rhizobium binxianense TaxID=3024242 RepID=UPI0023A9AC8A|nr:restriction endonuclease [Rhizobium sp. MJ22]WEA26920.1 restriction endonuclease [Rhizobium sp. MJ22]